MASATTQMSGSHTQTPAVVRSAQVQIAWPEWHDAGRIDVSDSQHQARLPRAPAPCAPQVAPGGAYLAARGTSRLPALQALEHTEPLCQQLKRDEKLGEGRAGRFIYQFRLIIELVACVADCRPRYHADAPRRDRRLSLLGKPDSTNGPTRYTILLITYTLRVFW